MNTSLLRYSLSLFLFSLLFLPAGKAQVANYYNFSQSAGTYTPGFPSGVSTPADIFPEAWDDLSYNQYKLPFDFTFNGTLYTAANGYIGLDTDGWFSFSNGAPVMTGQTVGGSWVTISDHTGVYLYGTANNNGFAGFNADLHYQSLATFTGTRTNGSNMITGVNSFTNVQIGTRLSGTGIPYGTIVTAFNTGTKTITMSASATANNSSAITPYASIYAFTRGTAPNRQFVVQWTQVRRYNSPGITTDNFNFQMILNEGGGVANLQTLQVVFGNVTTAETSNLEFQVGLRGASSGDFNARQSTSSWASTTAATANTDHVRLNNNIKPTSGLTFTWSPCTAAPPASGAITGASPVCPGSSQVYSINPVPGATSYTWTYSGTNTSFTASTTNPSNTFDFANNATGGTISVTPVNLCGSGIPSNLPVNVTVVSAAGISYPKPAYCNNASSVSVTLTGTSGGTYSALPAGLSINSSTGTVTPVSSTVGTYEITYTYTNLGCPLTATTNLEIGEPPAVIATASPAIVCNSGNSQLNATVTNGSGTYSVSSIPYSALTPTGSPTTLFNSYTDDGISSAINIPFTFTYFGAPATQFYVSTNGHIQLLAAGVTPNYFNQTIPDATTPNNVIALSWCDLVVDPTSNTGSGIRYFVNGASPNRVMVIEYNNLRVLGDYSELTGITGQIRLYEADSHIEIAAGSVNDNGETTEKTLGIENAAGTVAYSPSGRNNLAWNTSNEAWKFTPNTSTYTYLWAPPTYLSNPSVKNPVASGVASNISYAVKVTNVATGCSTTTSVNVNVTSPMAGTYTVGPGGNYTTLTAAVNDYNTRCIGGPITFSLTSNTYSGGETFPIHIKVNAYQNSVNTLTIKPAAGVNPVISANLPANGLIRISGSYIKIDGSNTVNGTTRNLTVTNTNTSTPLQIILNSGSSAAPVQEVSIKNCKISSGSNDLTFSGIVLSDSTTIYAPGYFKNDTIYNNQISKVTDGIFAVAAPAAGNGNGIYIAKNDLSTSGAANSISELGIYVEGVDGAAIEDNLMANFKGTDYNDDIGIWLALGCKNIIVNRNLIHSLNYTGGSGMGAYGIYLSTGNDPANVLISNNMIANISGDGWDYTSNYGYDNPAGILVYASPTTSQSGLKIYHNSINLNGNTLNNSKAQSFGIRLSRYNTADIRNNIVVNNLGYASGGPATGAVCVYAEYDKNQFQNLDYNNYFVNPTRGGKFFGGIGNTGQTTMAGWRTVTGKEANSMNINPVFTSGTDLHLTPASNLSLNETCLPLTEVPLDYDSTTRNGLKPDVGADEFLAPNTGSWVGRTSIDWLVKSNWETNTIPTSTTDVTVTGGYTHLPTIVTTQPVRDLILKNTNPVVTIDGGTLQVYRNFNVTAGYIVASNGTLEMKGTAAQTIPASLFQNNNLLNLIVDNTNTATGVSLGGALDIYRSVTFGSNGRKLTTNDNLTFKSTATQTAWLGQLTSNNIITGKATIERNIPLHSKAWQFLSTPINSSNTTTVKASWQEGATTPNGNPKPGYGVQLGSARTDAITQPSPGFDVKSFSPSIKVYDRATDNYLPLNRTDTLIYNPKGYMVFVRGDRSVINFSGANSSPTETILRMKGTLNTPASPPQNVSISSEGVESAGNPYPSAINFRKLIFNGSVNNNTFYLWDPKLTNSYSAYGLGAFQTFTWMGSSFVVTPGGGSFTGANTNIESGQAFFFMASGAGYLGFPESAKESGSNNSNRAIAPQNLKLLRTNMRVLVNDQPELIDGVLIQYGNYSNLVDDLDAVKLGNTGENLSILNANKLLSVERRKDIEATDTVFFNLGQLRVNEYEFQFIPIQIAAPGLQAWLEDNFLHTSTPVSLNDTNYIRFNIINTPASYAPNRFRLVFVQKHKIEIPGEGSLFLENVAGTQKQVKEEPAISVYPNPVVNREIRVSLLNFKPNERLMLQLINEAGNMVMARMVKINGKMETIGFDAKEIASGTYRILVTHSGGERLSCGVSVP